MQGFFNILRAPVFSGGPAHICKVYIIYRNNGLYTEKPVEKFLLTVVFHSFVHFIHRYIMLHLCKKDWAICSIFFVYFVIFTKLALLLQNRRGDIQVPVQQRIDHKLHRISDQRNAEQQRQDPAN